MENNMYNTGDIVFASSAPPGVRIFGHKGIILVENNQVFIYHNTPIQGYAIKDTLAEFEAAGRKIKRTGPSDLNADEIKSRFEQVKHKKFNWITWNCDQFVNFMLHESKYSLNQKIYFGIILFALSVFTIKKYKS